MRPDGDALEPGSCERRSPSAWASSCCRSPSSSSTRSRAWPTAPFPARALPPLVRSPLPAARVRRRVPAKHGIGLAATGAALVVGFLAALALVRGRFPGRAPARVPALPDRDAEDRPGSRVVHLLRPPGLPRRRGAARPRPHHRGATVRHQHPGRQPGRPRSLARGGRPRPRRPGADRAVADRPPPDPRRARGQRAAGASSSRSTRWRARSSSPAGRTTRCRSRCSSTWRSGRTRRSPRSRPC